MDHGGTVSAAIGDNRIQVTTTQAHGLEVGNDCYCWIAGTNGNGSWTVASVVSPTVFIYYPGTASPTGSVATGTIKLYPRP